jgi:HEAT repeat protein
MATRLSLDDKLAAVRELRQQPPSTQQTTELRRFIGDRSNLVVAAAAAAVGEKTLIELATDVEAAFDRFLVNPLKEDKLCRAKIAIITALDKLEHQDPDVFRKAAVHIQYEPVWGGEEDSAAPLRAAAIFALARIGGPADLALLADSLADPEKEVRIAAAQALASFGNEAARLLLRFKVRIGDGEPDVLSESLSGLLTIDPHENMSLVREFLDSDDLARCEAGALALGRSRLPEALDALKSRSQHCHSPQLRQHILLAIAMMRVPGAIDFLLSLVSSESDDTAQSAMSALKIHNYDPALRERLVKVVEQKGSVSIRARFERDFPAID